MLCRVSNRGMRSEATDRKIVVRQRSCIKSIELFAIGTTITPPLTWGTRQKGLPEPTRFGVINTFYPRSSENGPAIADRDGVFRGDVAGGFSKLVLYFSFRQANACLFSFSRWMRIQLQLSNESRSIQSKF